MCGIAAIFRFDGLEVDRTGLEQMTARLHHRGPDGGAVHVAGSVGLGFRRLSILDLSPAANQPMASDDGQILLVFNGEIYNYVELRDELRSKGYHFRSSGDTEVLLRAYQEWGPDCLPRLNGMWAFLVHDRRRGVLFGSRDRFGVKPLYWHRDPAALYFASEIKAIRACGSYNDGVDWERAASFLHHGRLDDAPRSFYRGITQLPAGTAFEVDRAGRMRQWNYWSLDDVSAVDTSDPVPAFRNLFENSVMLRMRSDVPVGVCLSGGLDSSSIICAADRLVRLGNAQRDQPLLAFCYMAPEFDETVYIDDILEDTGAQLKRLETNPVHLWDRLAAVLWYQDEPVHSMTAVVGFELMRLAAANGIRVILNGQGADETMGGYFSYFNDYWRELLANGRLGRAWREIGDHAATHEGGFLRLLVGAVRDVCQWQLSGLEPYRALAGRRRRARLETDRWFDRELARHITVEPGDVKAEIGLNTALKRSIAESSLPLYLRVEDRNSMAHSVEARLPFLDYRLVSLLLRLGSEWKMRGGANKFLLREAMRGRIPESVRVRRDKMGFPTPVKRWLAGELYGPVRELLEGREVRERGIYNVPAILQDLEAHRRGVIDVSGRIFRVVQFEMWSRMIQRG